MIDLCAYPALTPAQFEQKWKSLPQRYFMHASTVFLGWHSVIFSDMVMYLDVQNNIILYCNLRM